MNIIWKQTDYKNYFVSNDGQIRHNKKILKGTINSNGYMYVCFTKEKTYKKEYVHRVVAKAFLKNDNNFPCVNHKDGNKLNNNVNNLEWCSYLFNNRHSRIKLHNKGYVGKGRILCVETGDVFASSYDIKRKTGIAPQSILSVLEGKTKTAWGYHWEYTKKDITNIDCTKYKKKFGWKANLARKLGVSKSEIYYQIKKYGNISTAICKNFCFLFVVGLCLFGCARKDPVESIIDNHIEHINQVLDYSYNNIVQTQDVIFLEKELEVCQIGLGNTKSAYQAEISTCKAEKKQWQIYTFGLVLLICAWFFVKIKRIF